MVVDLPPQGCADPSPLKYRHGPSSARPPHRARPSACTGHQAGPALWLLNPTVKRSPCPISYPLKSSFKKAASKEEENWAKGSKVQTCSYKINKSWDVVIVSNTLCTVYLKVAKEVALKSFHHHKRKSCNCMRWWILTKLWWSFCCNIYINQFSSPEANTML